jgi:hypothetical protein
MLALFRRVFVHTLVFVVATAMLVVRSATVSVTEVMC